MIRELFEHPCNRLASVQRFSTVPTIHKESVAEHSFFVAWLAWKIALQVPGANVQTVIEVSIAHDLDEAFSGDMPHPFKHSDAKLKMRLEDVCYQHLETSLKNDPAALVAWEEGRSDSLEAQIVKFADLLSCLLFAYRERNLGSLTFANQILDRAPYTFKRPWDSRLNNFVAELIEFAERNYT